ncbi:hypothetical protein MX629_02680 [Carnobacterium divergens]|uniref:DUF4352 domain-containing protein n=1 Tax=Carnobacterium divergens TaxID=2748 RepID=A0AAW8R6C4_CARDV|nr:hypothetical protein [Carnobacterium divergens]MDT1957324.1 hypothetical protein [Carnobacterium divergens]MDT1973294.1 hypothetical protein [Carnobacterium divergens]
MKNLLIGLGLVGLLTVSACGNKEETTGKTVNEVSKTEAPKKNNTNKEKEVEGLGNYEGLKIGDKVSVKYGSSLEDKVAFDFTLNKMEYTDQSLGGKDPKYESGFIILDVTIKNTGKEPLEVDQITGVQYGSSIVVLGERYDFKDLSENKLLELKESLTGKMVVQYPKKGNQLTWGLEGFTTTFSYDIKADEIGDYVPE